METTLATGGYGVATPVSTTAAAVTAHGRRRQQDSAYWAQFRGPAHSARAGSGTTGHGRGAGHPPADVGPIARAREGTVQKVQKPRAPDRHAEHDQEHDEVLAPGSAAGALRRVRQAHTAALAAPGGAPFAAQRTPQGSSRRIRSPGTDPMSSRSEGLAVVFSERTLLRPRTRPGVRPGARLRAPPRTRPRTATDPERVSYEEDSTWRTRK